MNNELISIIVPVYNVEKYLKECVDSLINQTYKNIEIILVDDGSTDNSQNILKDYSVKYKNVKTVFKKNSGVSAARNTGIDIASGEYVLFVDSDDFLEKGAIEKLVNNVEKDCLLAFNYIKKFKNKEIFGTEQSFLINNKEKMVDKIFFDKHVNGIIANKFFIKKIIDDNNLRFHENIHYSEDLIFVCEYLQNVNKLKFISDNLYYYRMRKSSASYTYLNQKKKSIFETYNYILNEFSHNEKIKNYYEYHYLLDYKRLKKYIEISDINHDIISRKKEIIKKNNVSFLKKILYRNHYVNVLCKKIKNKIYVLYE